MYVRDKERDGIETTKQGIWKVGMSGWSSIQQLQQRQRQQQRLPRGPSEVSVFAVVADDDAAVGKQSPMSV